MIQKDVRYSEKKTQFVIETQNECVIFVIFIIFLIIRG